MTASRQVGRVRRYAALQASTERHGSSRPTLPEILQHAHPPNIFRQRTSTVQRVEGSTTGSVQSGSLPAGSNRQAAVGWQASAVHAGKRRIPSAPTARNTCRAGTLSGRPMRVRRLISAAGAHPWAWCRCAQASGTRRSSQPGPSGSTAGGGHPEPAQHASDPGAAHRGELGAVPPRSALTAHAQAHGGRARRAGRTSWYAQTGQ